MENTERENFLKLQLSKDLVVFLMNLLLCELPLKSRKEKAEMVFETWYKRVEDQLKIVYDQQMEIMFEGDPNINHDGEDIDKDCMAIILGLQTIHPSEIRKDFLEEMKDLVLKSFDANVGR